MEVQELCIISESDILSMNSDCILVGYSCLPVLQLLIFFLWLSSKAEVRCALGHNTPFPTSETKYWQTLLPLWYSFPYMHASCEFVRKSVELPHKSNNNGAKSTLVERGP